MSDAFDAVSELLDKQVFSDSKSDSDEWFYWRFSKYCAARQNLPNKTTTYSVPVHLSKDTKNEGKMPSIKIAVTL